MTIHGRAQERAALEAAVAPGAPGSCLALVGEAGIGKSALARHAAAAAREAGRAVIEGYSTLGLAEPLGVICDAVRAAGRAGLSPGAGRDRLATGFPALVLPELGGGEVETGNLGATFEAAARYLRALAGRRGLLVVLEDLHWADATSLSLVPFLARALRRDPVALVLTYRPDDETGSPALSGMRAELRRGRLADECLLAPLASEEAAALLAEAIGAAPAPDVRDELLRLSGGNPFALEELARAAIESGWLDAVSGRRAGGGAFELPWSLAEAIQARAARLEPSARELIAWAAAIGERFELRLLCAASGLSPDQALEGLAILAVAGLVAEDHADPEGESFAFRHALVHEALSREGLAAQRRRRHRAILEAGEALAAEGTLEVSSAQLARHAVAAGQRERAVAHSRAAVARAQELGAVEEAGAHLERALDLWTDQDGPDLHAELLFACGRARARLLRGDVRAVDLLERAQAAYAGLGDEAMAAWSLGTLAHARFEVGDVEGALRDWEAAVPELRRLGPRDALLTALATWAHGLAALKRSEVAERVADEGLALVPVASTAEQALDRVSLLTTKGMITLWRCDVASAEPLYREAARLAEEHHDDVGAARVLHSRAMANGLLVSVPEIRQSFQRATELVARHGLFRLQAFYLTWGAKMATEAGDWAGARRRGDEAEALLEPDDAAEHIRFMIDDQRAETLLGMGELEEALRAYDVLLDTPYARSQQRFEESVREDMARAQLLAGDTTAALAALRPALDVYVELIARGGAEVERAWLKVAVLAAAGQDAEAAEVQAWTADLLPGHPFTDACAALLEIPGLPAAAAAALEDAAARMEADGWRLDSSFMRVVGATIAARAEGGRGAAVTLLRVALARFRELGSEPMCRRLEARLRAMGARAPTGRGKAGAGGLSARELEVLGLVADGLTNKQIAEALVLSQNTVIRHVANIFAKLDAKSRAAAVAIASERGLMAKDGKALS